MNLLKRLKNLWKLSELDGMYAIPKDFKKIDYIKLYPQSKENWQKAQIIKKVKDPIEEIINGN